MSQESPRKVLMTGGAGLIGSVLAARLSDRYALTSFDRTSSTQIPSMVGDLADRAALRKAFTGHSVVIHLAAEPSEEASFEAVHAPNIVGVHNVYEAAREAGVRRLVCASSNHTMGALYRVDPWRAVVEGVTDGLEPGRYPLIDENDPVRPDGPYGVSKAFGETLGRYYHDQFGLSSIHLRIGWVIRDDDPTVSPFARSIWLSHRDLAQIVGLSIEAPSALGFGVYHATSHNTWKVFSLERARRELGYAPEDDAAPRGQRGSVRER
jgi:NAD+ dependent glucose-6-phosphate dehydrogenase